MFYRTEFAAPGFVMFQNLDGVTFAGKSGRTSHATHAGADNDDVCHSPTLGPWISKC